MDPEKESLDLKKNIAFRLCLATALFVAPTVLIAHQAAPSAANGSNMTEEQVNDANVQLMRQDVRSERKKVVAANMPLTDTEATKFWPVYDRYIAETIKVNDVRYTLLKEYAKNFDTANEEQADSFIKRWLALDQDNTQLRLKYIPEFEKVISHKKAAMFFQIEVADISQVLPNDRKPSDEGELMTTSALVSDPRIRRVEESSHA
jgi:hypothetical protein